MAKKIETLSDLTPDRKNANRGTERGRKMLEQSLQRFGAARSVVVDQDGQLIAGGQTFKAAREMGMDKVRVVEVTGDELVVVQRTDWKLGRDAAAREYAYADNRIGEVNLDFDPLRLADDLAEGVNIADLWTPDELDALLKDVQKDDTGGEGEGGRGGNGLGSPIIQYNIVFDSEEQQNRFHGLLRWLKTKHPAQETAAARLDVFLRQLADEGRFE